MNLFFYISLIIFISNVNAHLHVNEENSEWRINLRAELESKIQNFFTNFSKHHQKITFDQLKPFIDSLGLDIQSTVKIEIIDQNHDHDHADSHDHEHDHSHQETPNINLDCLRTKLDEMLNFVKSKDENKTLIDPGRFLNSGPYFAHGLTYCFSRKNTHNINYTSFVSAFVSALVITVIGILCYLVVPSIESEKFKYFFQFLVALAVGTLSGDSLLHLIPHAFIDHLPGQTEHIHDGTDVYKGLAAVGGIYLFFLIEKVMMIRRARKEKKHKELEMTRDDKIHVEISDERTEPDQSYYMLHANKDLKYIAQYLPNNPCNVDIEHHDSETEVKHFHKHGQNAEICNMATASSQGSNYSSEAESKLIPLETNPNCLCNPEVGYSLKKSHGHGHSHKHHIYKSQREKAHHDHHKKHEKELTDIKLIAWMVLMGDGLHNFADGLAIGVSFGSSLTTGFGTAIAVLCHELPHEIGDFAVLRRAGVSLKKALFFNAISGILCMFGVLVGLLIGGFDFFKNWSFLFIAGTFLYISLVDMIPELSENKEDDSISNFFIQSFGILFGVGIMFAIAVFEENIVNIFKQK